MKVIQLRGTNATGKTTAIRQFIERGHFRVDQIKVGARWIEYHWDPERRIAILGRYDKAVTGGVDGYITEKNQLLNSIMTIVNKVKPEALLFEGIVYGVTFQFAYELSRLLNKIGVEYTGICLLPSLNVVFERLAARNGGKAVDYMSVQAKWFSASRAYEKLRKAGVNAKAIDTTKIPKDQMYRIIEDEL